MTGVQTCALPICSQPCWFRALASLNRANSPVSPLTPPRLLTALLRKAALSELLSNCIADDRELDQCPMPPARRRNVGGSVRHPHPSVGEFVRCVVLVRGSNLLVGVLHVCLVCGGKPRHPWPDSTQELAPVRNGRRYNGWFAESACRAFLQSTRGKRCWHSAAPGSSMTLKGGSRRASRSVRRLRSRGRRS